MEQFHQKKDQKIYIFHLIMQNIIIQIKILNFIKMLK